MEDTYDHEIVYISLLNPINLQSGFLRSTNRGVTWEVGGAPLDNAKISFMTQLDGVLLVSAAVIDPPDSLGQTYRSFDRGITWEIIPGLEDQLLVNMLESDDGTLFAGAYRTNDIFFEFETVGEPRGIFKSIDGGETWQPVGMPLDDKNITALYHGGGRLYAGTNRWWDQSINNWRAPEGVWYSDDHGDSWTQAQAIDQEVIWNIVAGTGQRLFAGTDRGLFISTDQGVNWFRAQPPVDTGDFKIVHYAGVSEWVYAVQGAALYRSIDNGDSWSSVFVADTTITAITSDSGLSWVYAGTAGKGVFRNTDFSDGVLDGPWTSSSAPLDQRHVASLVPSGIDVYAGTTTGEVFLSPRGENVYFPLAKMPYYPAVSGVEINTEATGRNIIAYGLGIQMSDDGGRTWMPSNLNTRIWDAFIEVNIAFAGTEQGLYVSSDYLDWNLIPLTTNPIDALFSSSLFDRWYFGTVEGGDMQVYYLQKWSDVQDTTVWRRVTLPPANRNWFWGFFEHADVLYAHLGGGVYTSSDGGNSWIPTPLTAETPTMFAQNDTVFAGTTDGLYYSINKGASWEEAEFPLNQYRISLMFAAGGKLFAGTGGVNGPTPGNGLFVSRDGGINWAQVDLPGDDAKDINSWLEKDGAYYIGTDGEGIFRSKDEGETWTPLNTDLSEYRIRSLARFDPDGLLLAGTVRGVFSQVPDLDAPPAGGIFANGVDVRFSNSNTVTVFLNSDEVDSMIVSENPDFNGATWTPFANRIDNYLLSEDEGPKTLYARYKDISWNESDVDAVSIIVDKTKPRFQPHTPPPNAVPGQALTVSQQITEAHMDEVRLLFRRSGETWNPNTRSVTLERGAAGAEPDRFTWNGTIIEDLIRNKGIDYQIIATDSAGNADTLRNGNLDYFSLPVQLAAGELGNSGLLPSGTTVENYTLVSAPLDLGSSPAVTALFGDLGSYGQQGNWRFWDYRGESAGWREGKGLTLESGSAYFLILREGQTLTHRIAGTSIPTSAGVNGEIPGWQLRANDWTLVGNPYNVPLQLGQLKLRNRNIPLDQYNQVFAYEGGWVNAAGAAADVTLAPWSGLLIYADTSEVLVFRDAGEPFRSPLGKIPAGRSELMVLQEQEWLLQISAGSNGAADQDNFLGVKTDAEAELDRLDWLEPPLLPGGVSLSFTHPEWARPARLSADLRPPGEAGYRWDLAVRGTPGEAVALQFADLETLPANLQAVLLDDRAGTVRDLRRQRDIAVRIPESQGEKALSVLIGSEAYISRESNGLSTLPAAFSLGQNYPNPFNPATVIRYALPVPGEVTLKVYDLLGRAVLTLADRRPHQPGYYEAVADMRQFASGMYFYHLHIEGGQRFSAVKKMLLVK